MANRYAVATGPWSATATWSDTDGGAPGASAPIADDSAFFNAAVTVTLTANAACTKITMTRGTIDADTYDMDIGTGGFVATTTTYARGIIMGSGTWTCAGDWKMNWTNMTVTAETSTLILDPPTSCDFYMAALSFKNVRFSPGTYVRTMSAGTVTGTWTIDAGKTAYFLDAGTFTAATWVLTGAVGSVITLLKTGAGAAPTLVKSGGGMVEAHYVVVTNVKGSPVGTFCAYNSTDGGGTTGWVFVDPRTARGTVASNNVLFIERSVLDAATVTASSAVAGLPPGNVQDNRIRKVYRSSSYKNEWIKFDCGAATAIQGVFIGKHNFTQSAVVLWQGSPGDTWATPPLNVTLAVATDSLGTVVSQIASFWATAASYRWWRLYVRDSSNYSVGQLDVGRLFAGRNMQPTRNMRQDFSIEDLDPSVGSNVSGRQAYAVTRDPYRRLTYSVFDATADQLNELTSLYATTGLGQAFVVSFDPRERPTHNTMYVQFASPVRKRHRMLTHYDIEDVVFEEKV